MKVEHCQDCGIEIPKTKYSKRFRAFLCTKCREHRRWVRMIDLSNSREWRRKQREQKRIEREQKKMENIDKLMPPPLPLESAPFRMPLFGAIVPPRPGIVITREDVFQAKMPEPRRVKVKRAKLFLLGALWDKRDRTFHIFLPMLHIEIPIEKRGKKINESKVI